MALISDYWSMMFLLISFFASEYALSSSLILISIRLTCSRASLAYSYFLIASIWSWLMIFSLSKRKWDNFIFLTSYSLTRVLNKCFKSPIVSLFCFKFDSSAFCKFRFLAAWIFSISNETSSWVRWLVFRWFPALF